MYTFIFDFEYQSEIYTAKVKYNKPPDDTIWKISQNKNIIGKARVEKFQLICDDPHFYNLCSEANSALNVVEPSIWEQCNSGDPAIKNYREDIYSCNSIQNIATFEHINKLDFSGYKLSESDINTLVSSDLSCIRQIDVSCDLDANRFLERLFKECKSLRSLVTIDVNHSNVTPDTLRILKDKTRFNKPLVRDIWMINSGYKVAQIAILGVRNTVIMTEADWDELQKPAAEKFNIIYRYDNYLPGSVAHLQLIFE